MKDDGISHPNGADKWFPTHADTWFVYFIQAGGEEGPIKIGFSNDPTGRCKAIQRKMNAKCVLRRCVKVHHSKARALEKGLHEHFDFARITGEWFKPVPELLELATRK